MAPRRSSDILWGVRKRIAGLGLVAVALVWANIALMEGIPGKDVEGRPTQANTGYELTVNCFSGDVPGETTKYFLPSLEEGYASGECYEQNLRLSITNLKTGEKVHGIDAFVFPGPVMGFAEGTIRVEVDDQLRTNIVSESGIKKTWQAGGGKEN